MKRHIEALGFWPSLLIAGSCGFILALGAPPDGRLIGHWLGWVPLILMARQMRWTVRQALWLGLVGGMGVGLGGFPWIAEMLVKFVRVPGFVGFIGLLLFSLWMAVPFGLWAIGLRLGPRDGARGRVWAVVVFVSLQFMWPTLFPYTPLLGFAEQPEWMQLAEIGGVPLVESVVLLAAVCLADAIVAPTPRRGLLLAGAAGGIALATFGYGSWRMGAMDRAAEGARVLRIGLVQPNVPVGGGVQSEKLERLQGPSKRAEALGAELVVWPEAGTFPHRLRRPIARGPGPVADRVLGQHRLPTVFGASTRDRDADYGYNTALLMLASGELVAHYDKVNLVPLGEYIPLVDPSLLNRLVPQISHHFAGEQAERFVVEGLPGSTADGSGRALSLGPLICYEDIIPTYVLGVAGLEGGIDLFVNLTIDAWYGYSAEPWEHLALAQFRSVEHRIPLVRSVSTGVTAVVDYNGRLVAHIPSRPVERENLHEHPAEVLVHDVVLPRNTATAPTPYARFGWLYAHACVWGVLGTVAVAARRHWRSRAET